MFKSKKNSRKGSNLAKLFFAMMAVFITVSILQAVQLNDMLSHVRAIGTEVESLNLEQQSFHSYFGMR